MILENNKDWHLIKDSIFLKKNESRKRGRPPLDKERVLSAIFWVLENNARWKEIPADFPHYQTCRNYFYEWLKEGTLRTIFQVLISRYWKILEENKAKYTGEDREKIQKIKISSSTNKKELSKIAIFIKRYFLKLQPL